MGAGREAQFVIFSQVMAGIELALWDAIGKAADQPLHRILGGAVRNKISYFGFVQGDKPLELANHATALVEQGFSVLYVKIGRGEALDLDIVCSVRKAVGQTRLRLDANEVWDIMTARRMFEKLKPFDPEFIEQPMPGAGGAEALASLRVGVDIPIAADQSVYTPEDVYDICRNRAADVIVLGLHETCGSFASVRRRQLPRQRTSGSAFMASSRPASQHVRRTEVAATINNLDDGNQIMWQLLEEDLVESPNLTPIAGALAVSNKPGLGFDLDHDAVGRAAEAHRKQQR